MTDPDGVSAAALERYRARQRRPRIVYAAVVAVLVIAFAVVTIVAWTRGESNNTTSRAVADPPAALAFGTPSAGPRETWRSSARAAIGDPQWQGTVVVSDRHSVHGVDARTGKTTWTYSRSDRTVCTAAQFGGVTIAVYRLRGNCDEVTGVDSGTGERRWSRTLDMDGMPVVGTPQFSMATAYGSGTFLVRTTSVVYALDPIGGGNRWTYTRYGCRITAVTVGSAGGLISQDCSSRLTCGKLTFCFTGPQLFLLPNGFNRDEAKFKDTNPDHIVWNRRGLEAVAVSAGSVISALSGDALLQLNAGSGRTVVSTPVSASSQAGPTTDVRTTETKDIQYVIVGTTTYAIRPTIAEPLWTAPGAATVVGTDYSQEPDPDTARFTLASSDSATIVNGRTGKATGTYALSGTSGGALVYPLGRGFLVAASNSTTAYS